MTAANTVHEICISRMVTKIGLVKVGAAFDLRTACLRVHEFAKASPGDYVVFNPNTGRVLAKVSNLCGKMKLINTQNAYL